MQEKAAGLVSRIVFAIPHPEAFARISSHGFGSIASSLHVLGAERSFDAAIILATGQIPRPGFPSAPSMYSSKRARKLVIPFRTFCKRDGRVSRILETRARLSKDMKKLYREAGSGLRQTGAFTLAEIDEQPEIDQKPEFDEEREFDEE